MSAAKASGCFRKVTVRFQDASHGYNQDAGCFARKRQGFRMFQDVSQGRNKGSGCYAGLQLGYKALFQDVSQGFKQAFNDGGNALMVL